MEGRQNRRIFYIEKGHAAFEGWQECKLSDIGANDTVAIRWKMKRVAQSDRRMVKTLDIRPLLQPGKLQVGQIGYLPLQHDAYHFVCEYVDDEKVLVREIIEKPICKTNYAFQGGVRVAVGQEFVKTERKEGEPFFLHHVDPSSYAVGRRAVIDGKWKVSGTAAAAVTKSSAIVTTKTTGAATSTVERDAQVKREGQGESETTINGK